MNFSPSCLHLLPLHRPHHLCSPKLSFPLLLVLLRLQLPPSPSPASLRAVTSLGMTYVWQYQQSWWGDALCPQGHRGRKFDFPSKSVCEWSKAGLVGRTLEARIPPAWAPSACGHGCCLDLSYEGNEKLLEAAQAKWME